MISPGKVPGEALRELQPAPRAENRKLLNVGRSKRRDWLRRFASSAAGFGLAFKGSGRVRASSGKQTVIHTVGGKEVAIPESNPDTMVAHALDKTVYPAQWPYTARDFFRLDGSDDAEFYAEPKLVKHLEDQTLAALTRFYAAVFPKDQAFDALGICSSWISHYPKEPKPYQICFVAQPTVDGHHMPRPAPAQSRTC